MFGKKAKPRPSGEGKSRNNDLANMMGLGMPPMDDDDDSGLLAELAALQGEAPPTQKKGKPKKGLVSMDVIDKMTYESMKDIDEMDDSDIDENELLAELEGMSDDDEEVDKGPPPQQEVKSSGNAMLSLLSERKQMYETAIQNAKAEGASSKVRRLDRGLKEIDSLRKKVEKGAAINEEEIPPPVATKASKPIDPNTQTLPSPPAATKPQPLAPVQPITSPEPKPQPAVRPRPPPPSQPEQPQPESSKSEASSEQLTTLLENQKQFKILALKMKHEGNMDEARKYLAISKQFDTPIQAVKDGKQVDLSNMPKLPTGNMQEANQTSAQPAQPTPPPQPATPPQAAAASKEPLPAPKTILEALQQRLAIYEEAAQKAKEEGNGSKSRRMGRIVKQYQDAIKANKAKKPFDYNELPTPPDCPPIPGLSAGASSAPDTARPAPSASLTPPAAQPQASPRASPTPIPQQQPQIVKSRNQKEYEFLVQRQKEFKAAALQAKRDGDIDSAREYLRQAKSLDEMILGAENGLRVDVTAVPSLKRKSLDRPKSGSTSSNSEPVGIKQPVTLTGSNAEQYVQLENALRKQIETSETNCQHYKLLGNLDAAKNFESLLNSSTKDLETLLYYKKNRSPVPKCNYITKSFPVVRSNPELSDSELEIIIVRCVNVPLPSGWQPKDMHIYVTYEFPYPPDKQPQVGNTATIKETVNPEFNQSFKVEIERKNRSFPRFCKRQSCNVKVNYVRGFLKSDKAIGQASIKLEKFYNKCEIHESLDLVDLDRGRKSVGGKIEIKLKIREPLVDKDAEIVKEKWLVLDSHLRSLEMKTQQISPRPQEKQPTYDSLEVLKYEKESLEKQYHAYKSQGRQPPAALVEKIKSCNSLSATIQNKMKQSGKQGIIEYYENLSQAIEIEKRKAQQALQNNDKESAKECLVKKKLLEKEIGVMKQRLGLK